MHSLSYYWLFVFGALLAIVPHEAGHVLMATLVGFKPREMFIGRGITIFRVRIGQTWIIVQAPRYSGAVRYCAPPPGRPVASILVSLGGALGNFVAGAVLAGVVRLEPSWGRYLGPVIMAQLVVGLLNLVPYPNRRADGSDGWHVVQSIFGRRRDYFTGPYAFLMEWVLPPGTPHPPPSEDASELIYQLFRANPKNERWILRDVRRALVRLIDRDRLSRPERACALDILVSNEVTIGNTGISPDELDRWSQEAIELRTALRSPAAYGSF